MTTALCLAEGTSIITEGIWGKRYRYTEELTRMGANHSCGWRDRGC